MTYREAEVEAMLRAGGAAAPAGTMPAATAARIEAVLDALPASRGGTRRLPGALRSAAVMTAAFALLAGGFWLERDMSGPAASGSANGERSAASPAGSGYMGVVGQTMPEADGKTGPSVADQGVEAMLREVLYDKHELGIRYAVSADRDIGAFRLEAKLYANETLIGTVGRQEDGTYGELENRYERADDGTYEGVLLSDILAYKGLPNHFQLRLVITRIGDATGNWSFELPVQGDEGRVALDETLERSNALGTLQVRRVTVSPVSTMVDYAFLAGDVGDNTGVGVDVIDDRGYRYGGAVLIFSEANRMPSLPLYLRSAIGAKQLFVRLYTFDSRIDPRKLDSYRTVMEEPPTPEHPLKLPLGEGREIELTGIDYLADQTIVHAIPSDYGGGFLIEDERGKAIPLVSWGNGNGVRFEPVRPGEKLTFVSLQEPPRTYRPELTVPIELEAGEADAAGS